MIVQAFTNLYGCAIGDGTRVGTFVEIQRGASIGASCKIQSHTFICDGVTIEDDVFVGHGVMFINDKFPRATNAEGQLQTEVDWQLLRTVVERGASIGSGAIVLGGIRIGARRARWRRCRRHPRRARRRDRGRQPPLEAIEDPAQAERVAARVKGRGWAAEAEAPRARPAVSRPGSSVANRSLYAAPPRSRRNSRIPSASASCTAWASRTKPAGWFPSGGSRPAW